MKAAIPKFDLQAMAAPKGAGKLAVKGAFKGGEKADAKGDAKQSGGEPSFAAQLSQALEKKSPKQASSLKRDGDASPHAKQQQTDVSAATHDSKDVGHALFAQFHQALAFSLPTTTTATLSPTAAARLATNNRTATARTVEALTAKTDRAEKPELPAESVRPSMNDASARPAGTFSLELTKESSGPSEVKTPALAPAWMPADAAHDDGMRLSVSASSMRWVTEGGGVQLQIRGTEVSVRAHGAVAHDLARTETELRLSLAQGGLTLKDITAVERSSQSTPDSTQNRRNDDESPSEHRRQQRHDEGNDEWN